MSGLFDIEESVKPIRWDEYVMTLSFDETEIIRWIMALHNNGKPFEVDPTYSVGRFWEGLPAPVMKFDISPQVEGVIQADARAIPLPDASVSSIMFDPPFIVGNHNDGFKDGIIKSRFSYYKTIKELWQFYKDAMLEFYRILQTNGILCFKCQDCIDSGKQRMSHFEIMKYAEAIGYYCKDFFVLARQNVIFSPNMEKQQHARKNHCYFIVFRKEHYV